MDQATQQNAALVEQMAAAASRLKTQASELVEVVAVFKLDVNDSMVRTTVRSSAPKVTPFTGGERRTQPKVAGTKMQPVASKPASLQRPVRQAKAEPIGESDDWETF
jgi:hypothetical protein